MHSLYLTVIWSARNHCLGMLHSQVGLIRLDISEYIARSVAGKVWNPIWINLHSVLEEH
jgi:hypothetical protein